MSCNVLIPVDPVSKYGQKFVKVPCGVCPKCQKKQSNDWKTRLMLEFQTLFKRGYKFGFLTLTYRNERLPYYNFSYLGEDKSVPCFSKKDCQDFLESMRQYVYRKKAFVECLDKVNFRFMLCCEYGSNTHRPHYHLIFAVSSFVDVHQFGEFARKVWSDKGFVFPSSKYSLNGGYDRKGRYHFPFEVQSNTLFASVAYCAKYCAKDLNFYNAFYKFGIDCKGDEFKGKRPFHLQSRSLGLSLFDTMTDEQRKDYYFNGVSFIAGDKKLQLPMYLKNKILFNIVYKKTSTGRRLVRRTPTQFFYDNYEAIYEKRKDFYASFFNSHCSQSTWENYLLSKKQAKIKAKNFSFLMNKANDYLSTIDSNLTLVDFYLAYYGCREYDLNLPPAESWFLRYSPNSYPYLLSCTFPREVRDFLEYCCNYLFFNVSSASKLIDWKKIQKMTLEQHLKEILKENENVSKTS